MMLLDANFCQQTANIWKIIGIAVTILKIVIPLILIILGMIDLGKAVVSSDEKQINKSVQALIKRFIAAVIILLVPAIISAFFNVLEITNLTTGDAKVCIGCITSPYDNCDTRDAVGF